jgi:hypothetical protein
MDIALIGMSKKNREAPERDLRAATPGEGTNQVREKTGMSANFKRSK